MIPALLAAYILLNTMAETRKSVRSTSDRAYDAIKEQMAALRKSGRNQLPPEPDLAEAIGVSRVTIRRVLARLESERLIDRQKGRGTFIRPRPHKQRLTVLYGSHVDLFDPWMAGILRGVSGECARRGIALSLNPVPEHGADNLVDTLISDVRSRHADGYLIACPLPLKDCLRMRKKNIPLVLIEEDYGRDDIPAVMLDHAEAARLAAEYCTRRGGRNIALISGPLGTETVRKADVIAAALRAATGSAAPAKGRNHMVTDRSVAAGRHAMRQLLRRKKTPDAVLTTDDDLAIGALLALRESANPSHQTPEMIAYINPHANLRDLLPWTVIEAPPHGLLGTHAVDMLSCLVAGNRVQPALLRLPPRLRERE